MKKWSVWFTETYHYNKIVEATTVEEAEEKTLAMDRADMDHCKLLEEMDIETREVEGD